MADDVIILAADREYLRHAQSLMVNCRLQGQWTGDFCMITPEGTDVSSVAGRGVELLSVSDVGFMQKFWMFDGFFRGWRKAIWLDCDVLVHGNLYRLLELVDTAVMVADRENGSILGSFWRDTEAGRHLELYYWMFKTFPSIMEKTFNTSCVTFRPKGIPEGTPERLIELQAHVKPANHCDRGGTDQQIINLLLYDYFAPVPDRLCCYWNETTSNTVVSHYCRWYAPWLEKVSHAHAYSNPVLARPCKDVYEENLSKFDQLFPRA
jgi:lipopolysaccharide biosynthesis glycosyltransferase